MKTITKITLSLLVGAAVAVSCKKEEPTYTITADRTEVTDIAATTPGEEVIVVTTDAPYWILQTPEWVTANPVTGVGGGESTIVTLTVAPNYKNETTKTKPRSGALKFSGGKTSLSIPISQLGYQATIDPSLSIGGIPSMEEFRKFITAVNEGASVIRWMNNDWEVELLTDLDLAEFTEWTPIGNVESTGNANNGCKLKGNAFDGIFNGGGHTIRNFKVTHTATEGSTFGLFGALDNATVKNLNVEAEWNISANGVADVGIVAGTVYCSTIENVKVNAVINSAGTTASGSRFAIGGIAGFVFSFYDSEDGVAHDSWIKDCETTATVNLSAGSNTAAGATGMMYGGIAAFATNVKDDSRNHIENCVNNGTLTTDIGRCSGILPTANYGTIIQGCTNNATQINNNGNGRIGQICCNLSENSAVIDCVNTGDLTTTGASTTAGALVALIGNKTAYLEGGERCCNTGTILGCNVTYLSLLCANNNAFDHISNVILSGRLGVYKADGNHEMYDVNSANIMEFIGYIAPAYADKMTNITYVSDPGTIPGPDEPAEPESPDKNGGIDGLDLVNDTWN